MKSPSLSENRFFFDTVFSPLNTPPPLSKMGPFSSVFYVGTGLQGDKVHLSAISPQPLFPFPLGFSQQYSHYRPLSDSMELSSLSRANEERGCQVGQNGTVFTPPEPQHGKRREAPLQGSLGHCHAVWENHFWEHGHQLCDSQRTEMYFPKNLSSLPGLQAPGQAPKLTIQA